MPATDDYDTAVLWIEDLEPQGIEGVVAKPGRSAYRGGDRIWQKVRHTEVVDVAVIGYTGASAPGTSPCGSRTGAPRSPSASAPCWRMRPHRL
ncbi:DNA ligase-like domain-containing protein [Streptomyces lavendulocolor]|uniref:hypothetical protein n=1 Tax=Streptomyces lavendulocolor TaxID=67316 RepID=UPI0031D4C3D8